MSASYQRLPTSPSGSRPSSPHLPDSQDQNTSTAEDSYRPLRASVQAEFNRPAPSWWKRAAILAFMVFLGWLSLRLGAFRKEPEIIYASRYSEEFKYRPAASPVITEHLSDGRIRLRGASPGGLGVRPEDMPKTPAQKRAEEKKRIKEAREAARQKLGLRKNGKTNARKVRHGGGKTEV